MTKPSDRWLLPPPPPPMCTSSNGLPILQEIHHFVPRSQCLHNNLRLVWFMHKMLMEMQLQMLIAATVKDSDADPRAPQPEEHVVRWRALSPSPDSRQFITIAFANQRGDSRRRACAQDSQRDWDWTRAEEGLTHAACQLSSSSRLFGAHSYANPSTLVTTNEMPTRRNAKRASNCKWWDGCQGRSVDKVAPE